METCRVCAKAVSECECKKYLDEEDVLEEQENKDEVEEETEESKEEEESEGDESEEEDAGSDDTDEVESEDDDWQEKAKKSGWVPDHVREKHAREAQTLRDQVANLQRLIQMPQEEEVDENEVVRHGDLARHLENLQRNIASIQDPAVISEILIRQQVGDYDEVVVGHLEPFSSDKPWVADILRGEPNPAKAAYELGKAIRDGREFYLGFKDGKQTFVIKGEDDVTPKPKKKDPKRPPVEALERSKKQPKSLDEIPSASGVEAAEMSVEEFWKMPTDTLMRIRMKNPDLYDKMSARFHEKYG